MTDVLFVLNLQGIIKYVLYYMKTLHNEEKKKKLTPELSRKINEYMSTTGDDSSH